MKSLVDDPVGDWEQNPYLVLRAIECKILRAGFQTISDDTNEVHFSIPYGDRANRAKAVRLVNDIEDTCTIDHVMSCTAKGGFLTYRWVL
jgi:hypothetical protein